MRLPASLAWSLAILTPCAIVACGLESSDHHEAPAALAVVAESITRSPAEHQAHYDRVMTSKFCGECHSAIYTEHEQNTHGRAFSDEEVRLATGRFDHGDCIRCHTPRPVFETGIGMNPLRRFHNLEEGNTCMTCHWKEGVDYGVFQGGADCKGAFDPRVGTVEACATCHRNHGTPYQWEIAPTGKLADTTCMDCHMETVERPIADGGPVRRGHSHEFPGCRSETQVRRAYTYEAVIDGNEAVIQITNKGAGHHFPTELKQRAVESLVVVTDAEGKEVARSRMIFRDPYKRPYGLNLPVNTQIKPGETKEHRVPISVASGTVRTELHFKFYYPIEDFHPELARLLESRTMPFDGVTPSTKPVETAPDVKITTPDEVSPEIASVANLIDYSRPTIDKVEVEIPQGEDAETVKRLIELMQFPVPEANRAAVKRLSELGEKAIPGLIEALGSWDNKTFNQSMAALSNIGEKSVPALVAALSSDQLYIRVHARVLLGRMGWAATDAAAESATLAALSAPNAMDRTSAADLCGFLGWKSAVPRLRELLSDLDADVIRSAALGLVRLKDGEAIPALKEALGRVTYPETKRDLARALALLHDTTGIDILLDGLDYGDDLIRESYFETFFAVTGQHLGYEPLAPRDERLAAIMRLRKWWAEEPAKQHERLRHPRRIPPAKNTAAWKLVEGLADVEVAAPPDEETMAKLRDMVNDAVPALVLGLKYPAGFAEKRRRICELLAELKDPNAVPALMYALRDPVISVAGWAAYALGEIGDPESLTAVRRYGDRVRGMVASGRFPASAGSPEVALAHASRAQLLLGDNSARNELVQLLLSADLEARSIAIDALEQRFGSRRGYDPEASLADRREAAKAWVE
jgi:HEAT repeat protein